MRKLIAAINMTLDGYCDHDAVDAQAELHRHYADLLGQAGDLLYGRVTFQLMEFWQSVLLAPTGKPDMDQFAVAIDSVPKTVFSRTMADTGWESARIAPRELEEEVRGIKATPGRPILAGSPSLIVQLMRLGLVDELQLCVHPVIAGGGRLLFAPTDARIEMHLTKTKPLAYGPVVLYYQPR